MGFFKRKISASEGLIATTANAINMVYTIAEEDSAIHFSAIAVALGHEHANRLGISCLDTDAFKKYVWKAATAMRPELITKFIPFTLFSIRAIKIWETGGDPEKAYYQRHYSEFVEGVPFEEFEQFYFNLAAAFEDIVEIERWNWTLGR